MRVPPGKMPALSTSMSMPPNARTRRLERRVARPSVEVTSHATPRKSGAPAACRSTSALRSRPTTAAPRFEEGLDTRLADARRGAGDQHDLARERRRLSRPCAASPARGPSTRRRRCPSPAARGSRRAPRPPDHVDRVRRRGRARCARPSRCARPRRSRAPGSSTMRGAGVEHGLRLLRERRVALEVLAIGAAHKPATSRPSIGTRLVRITWSGVAGPCCESAPTSPRCANARNLAPRVTCVMTIGAPAASPRSRGASARARARCGAGVARRLRGAGRLPRAALVEEALGARHQRRSCARTIPSRVSPNEKMPWFMSTMPIVPACASAAKRLRAQAARGRSPA